MNPLGLFLILASLGGADVRPDRPGPALSRAEAEALARKLEAVEKRKKTGQPGPPGTILVTEQELNSYLNLSLGPQMPAGLSDIEVRMDRDRIAAKAMVDLDQVKGRATTSSPWNPFALLTGRVPVELKGRFPNGDGFGSLEFEEVRLGSVPVPVSFLEQIVSSSTRTPENPQGFDILAPFRLPYALKRVRLQPGRAMLDF